jgi:hypothetical protein
LFPIAAEYAPRIWKGKPTMPLIVAAPHLPPSASISAARWVRCESSNNRQGTNVEARSEGFFHWAKDTAAAAVSQLSGPAGIVLLRATAMSEKGKTSTLTRMMKTKVISDTYPA